MLCIALPYGDASFEPDIVGFELFNSARVVHWHYMSRKAGSSGELQRAYSKDALLQLLAEEGLGRWVWNVLSGEVFWCPKVYEVFSVTRFDNRVESFQKLIHPEDIEPLLARTQDLIRDGVDIRGYFRIRSDDGDYREMYNAGRVIKDKRGKPAKIIGYVRACRPDESGRHRNNLVAEEAQPRDMTPDIGLLEVLLDRANKSQNAGDRHLAELTFLQFILLRTDDPECAAKLSARLLKRFGSFGSVVNSDPAELLKVDGTGQRHERLFKIIRLASTAMYKPQDKPLVFSSVDDVIFYLRSVQAYGEREQFRVLFLNHLNHITHDEVLSEGSSTFVPVDIRDVVKRALELDTKNIVIVHNHPSGDPTPSMADIDLTHRLVKAAKSLEINVVDHIVLGRFGHSSFRALGLIS